jgi:hypothetical protein
VLYRVGNGSPVVLLYGRVPDWRVLGEGVTGADVAQLNHDLVRLGYAPRADMVAAGWDYYSPQTSYAVQQLKSTWACPPLRGACRWGRWCSSRPRCGSPP